MTVPIHEGYVRTTHYCSTQAANKGPSEILSPDVNRVWASLILGAFSTDIGISTNPHAALGDPDVCTFLPSQGAVFFETYGTNALYLIGYYVNSNATMSITTVHRNPKATYDPNAQNAEKIVTSTGHTVIPAAVGNFQAFLPADPLRTRVTVKTDSTLALLSDGVDSMNFMPIAPFFPGYAAIETSDAIAFSTAGGAHVDNAWWIIDRRVPVDAG